MLPEIVALVIRGVGKIKRVDRACPVHPRIQDNVAGEACRGVQFERTAGIKEGRRDSRAAIVGGVEF